MFHKQLICSLVVTFAMVLAYPTYADRHDDRDGHALVQDVHKAGTEIEFEEIRTKSTTRFVKAIFAPFPNYTRR